MSGFTAAQAIVICRREQLRAAATVLSCFPIGSLPPLFVLESPPCTEEDYAREYAAYRDMRNLRDQQVGTAAARRELREDGHARGWSNEEIDRRIDLLTPFRGWVKRARLLASVFRTLPLRRAIFLFAATPQDMSVIEPLPKDRLDDQRHSLLPENLEWVTLLPEAPDGPLWRRAWDVIRPGERTPEQPLEVGADSIAVIAGLYRSLQGGVPLHVGEARTGTAFEIIEPADTAATEAVVIEASEDAGGLAGVHYALRQRARLCVFEAPDLAAIDDARASVQARQEGADAASARAALSALEGAVARAIPDRVVDAVGALPLTAFTQGVPYHLLSTSATDWTAKPIGLMTGDTLLLCAMELFGAADDARARFNLLFDPGYFRTDETAGVLQRLRSATAYPLLLQGAAASNTALIAMGGAPLDLVYFNTHGSAGAVLLRDMPLPADKLLQRVLLRSRPIVFNNSCLSWTGVGREFLSAGARGYIGTLWSIDAEQAAVFAAVVTGKIIVGEQPVAASIRGTGVDPITEKAYVFVGPVGARLRASAIPPGDEPARIAAAASVLLQIGLWLCQQGPQADSPLIAPVLNALHANARTLVDEIERRWPDPDRDRVRLLTEQLELASRLAFDERNAQECVAWCKRGFQLIGQAADDSTTDLSTRAAFLLACARVGRRLRRWQDVISLLSTSAQKLEAAGRTAGDEYLELSDAYRENGQIDQALATALRARAAFATPGGDAATRGAMLAEGRLAQLYCRVGNLDEAVEAAKNGFDAAVRAQDLDEQAVFKMDESRIQVRRGDPAAAVIAATEALAVVRRARDEDKEVAAYGALTLALIADARWDRAREIALAGLDAARVRGLHDQSGDFLRDLSRIARATGDLPGALAKLRDAGAALAITRHADRIKDALNETGELLAIIDTWDAERAGLMLIADVIGVLDRVDRSSVCTHAVGRLLRRIAAAGWAASRDGLWLVRRDLDRVVAAQGASGPEQLRFIRDVVGACHDRAKGLNEAAAKAAAALDAMSQNGFGLASFVTNGAAPDPPA